MLANLRPFFLSFQSLLHQKIPAEDLHQAAEESLWEYACLDMVGFPGRPPDAYSLVRLGSICLRYFRLMRKAGLDADSAIVAISEACGPLEGQMGAAAAQSKCSLAGYFESKNAPELCAAAFCRRCPKRSSGCETLERLLVLALTARDPAPRFIGKLRIFAPARIPAVEALARG